MRGKKRSPIFLHREFTEKPGCGYLNVARLILTPATKSTKRSLLLVFCNLFLFLNARADYTVANGTNINAATLTGQSGVLTINGTLTVSSNTTLSGFTSIIINAPNGQIYWSNNSDLTFSAGTTISIASGALGLQSNGSNSSQRLIVGNVIIAVSNDNSNAAAFNFTQFNALGGLPQYTSSYSAPACSGNAFSATVSAIQTVTGVNYTYSWSISPSSGTFTYNSNQSTATITPAAGTYTVTCVASANTYQTSFTFNINIPLQYTWLGSTYNWSDLSDWCPGVPVSTSSVTIPAGVKTPTIASGTTATVNNLTIANGATLIVNGTLQVEGTITNNGTLDLTNGTLEMNGTSPQTIAGSMFYNKTVKNLVVSNTAGLSVSSTASDTLKISGGVTFGNPAASLNTGDNIDFLSTQSGTAYLGTVGISNTITGKAIVDRYINVGTASGQHSRAWEFLSTPTSGQTIRQSWMENGSSSGGYGIWLTGPGGTDSAFDAKSPAYAIKSYDVNSNNWIGTSNANKQIYNNTGYMVFIRGDRTVNGTTVTTATPTILRSKGSVFTGSQPAISVLPDHFQSVGNPYASPIDFTLMNRANGVDNLYYAWDPYLYGSYGYGGYQTLSATNGWVPVPGGTTAYPTGVACSTIRSGQAFFVHATSTSSVVAQNPTLSINESSKITPASNVNFARKAARVAAPEREYLRTDLFVSPDPGAAVADGNAVAFDNSFSNRVDGNDALKFFNSGENFALRRDGKYLAVEAKAPVTSSDTIFFAMSSMRKQSYLLRIVPVHMQSESLQAYLLDNYLNTSTALSLSDTNNVTFLINSSSASSAGNRFSIVFREMAALPVTITSLDASLENREVLVDWKTENESGMVQYEVQKSTDGTIFTTSSITPALNDGKASYQWTDFQLAGIRYYRIKSVSKDGKISYSQVVKVNGEKIFPVISVAPNPIVNGTIHLLLLNQRPGIYMASMTDQLGQVVLSKKILHSAMSASEKISVNSVPGGVYNLAILKPDGNKVVIKIFVN